MRAIDISAEAIEALASEREMKATELFMIAEACRNADRDPSGWMMAGEYAAKAAAVLRAQAARVAKLEAALRIADAACATYYEWEYGTDLEAEVNASLLVAWKKDHDARAALSPEPR